MSWAANDYEPTADEIAEFLRAEWLDDAEPGAHGVLEVIPSMERLVWSIPVYWGNRQVAEDGTVTLHWVLPPPCDHCGL
jgi:hypothetical protein